MVFMSNRRGASAVEYGLLAGLIAIGAVFGVGAVGGGVANLLAGAGQSVDGAAGAVGGTGDGAGDDGGLAEGGQAPSGSDGAVVTDVVWADGVYTGGDLLRIEVVYDEAVAAAGGTPEIPLDVAGVFFAAPLVSGTGTNTLVFETIVPPAISDSDGVALAGAGIDPREAVLTTVDDGSTSVETDLDVDFSGVLVSNDPAMSVAPDGMSAPAPRGLAVPLVAVDGTLVAVRESASPYDVLLYDAADVAAPRLVARIGNPTGGSGWGNRIDMEDGVLVAAGSGDVVHAFDVSAPSNPQLLSSMTPADRLTGENFAFGNSVAVDDGVVLVGAFNNPRAGSFWNGRAGAAYLYDAESGTELHRWYGSQSRPQFGLSVSMRGGLAFVLSDVDGSNDGEVTIYDVGTPGSPSWTDSVTIASSDGVNTMDYDAGVLAVGDEWWHSSVHADAGRVQLYDVASSGTASYRTYLTAPDADAGELFGASLDVERGRIAVRSGQTRVGANTWRSSGTVYLFDAGTLTEERRVRVGDESERSRVAYPGVDAVFAVPTFKIDPETVLFYP